MTIFQSILREARMSSPANREHFSKKNRLQAQGEFDSGGSGVHVVSRMYKVSPRESERDFLRSLHTQVPGAVSTKIWKVCLECSVPSSERPAVD